MSCVVIPYFYARFNSPFWLIVGSLCFYLPDLIHNSVSVFIKLKMMSKCLNVLI